MSGEGRRGDAPPAKQPRPSSTLLVVCVKARDMKEAWCLAASNAEASAREIINYYAKRWTIEPGFRDTKDLRFGMGLSVLRIADPQRRDRLLLLNAFAIVLRRCSAPPAKASAWIAISRSTPPNTGPIRCSGRAVCSTS